VRSGKDFSKRFPSLGRALEPLADETVVDGEIVVRWCRDFSHRRRDTMASGRFLFVSFDGGGNTAPTYPLVRRVVARGHKVTLLGQPAQAEAARALGATFAPLGLPDWTPGASIEEQEEVLLSLLFGPAVGEAVLESLDREAPEVLVVDCMLTSGLAAAERSRLPAAALVHLLYEQFVRGTTGRMWEAALPTINTMRARFGLPPAVSPMAVMDRMKVVLVACPQEFDVAMPDLPANVRYVGAIRDDPPTDKQKSPWGSMDGQPRVLVAFSTTYQHQEEALRRTATALAAFSVQAIITVGSMIDLSTIESAPNVAIHRALPHAAQLPDCALVVTHAGFDTVMAALAHGVPLLWMPMGRDQYDNAARVAACGAGIVLSADAGVAEIRHAMQDLLTKPDYQVAARHMAAMIARQDGRETAIKELETLLGTT
jgi:MGT family glycosyltransferase